VRARNLTTAYNLPEYFVVRGAQEFTVKYEGEFPTQHWHACETRNDFFEMLDGARQSGYIGWASTGEVVTLTVSVYGMKVRCSCVLLQHGCIRKMGRGATFPFGSPDFLDFFLAGWCFGVSEWCFGLTATCCETLFISRVSAL
jgi:hypothetical protein